jgi:hypothetical protein
MYNIIKNYFVINNWNLFCILLILYYPFCEIYLQPLLTYLYSLTLLPYDISTNPCAGKVILDPGKWKLAYHFNLDLWVKLPLARSLRSN